MEHHQLKASTETLAGSMGILRVETWVTSQHDAAENSFLWIHHVLYQVRRLQGYSTLNPLPACSRLSALAVNREVHYLQG